MRDWTVLLIGGAAGVGKTSLSYRLARYYEVGITEVDDFAVVLETMTTPEQMPLLHYWRTNFDEFLQMSQEAKMAYFLQTRREIYAPAICAVIANHLETNTPIVLEGDFILPEVALLNGQPHLQVRSLFVYEDDESQIARNFAAREGDPQTERAHSSYLMSEWMRQECARLNQPTIPARPWDTILERAISLLG